MPRPIKCRKVCRMPETRLFRPDSTGKEDIILSLDEFESIRLIDKEQLSQQECSVLMGVARTTVQKIYVSAREKIASALVEGRAIRIEGGDVRVCDGDDPRCCLPCCHKQGKKKFREKTKGENTMRIAVTYENGNIFQHFGHTAEFKIYDIENGGIIESQVVSTGGQGHGALAAVLFALKADVLICGGIGGGAQNALSNAGIKWYAGVSGSADAAVAAFLAGELDYDPEAICKHHHHSEGHDCASHSCGDHGCHH